MDDTLNADGYNGGGAKKRSNAVLARDGRFQQHEYQSRGNSLYHQYGNDVGRLSDCLGDGCEISTTKRQQQQSSSSGTTTMHAPSVAVPPPRRPKAKPLDLFQQQPREPPVVAVGPLEQQRIVGKPSRPIGQGGGSSGGGAVNNTAAAVADGGVTTSAMGDGRGR